MHAAVTIEAPVLPPLFTAERVSAAPFAAAQARAAETGAGTLLWAMRPGSLAFALVLEPEQPLREARAAFAVAAGAVADALAALSAPERSVAIRWPGEFVYDAGRIGGARLAWPDGAAEEAVPDWLVFGADLLLDRDEAGEPGRFPDSTSLKEEGFEAPLAIVESFARYVTLHMDAWETRGYPAAVQGYLGRLTGFAPGTRVRLDGNGDLLAVGPEGDVRHELVPALAGADWYDPARDGVRL